MWTPCRSPTWGQSSPTWRMAVASYVDTRSPTWGQSSPTWSRWQPRPTWTPGLLRGDKSSPTWSRWQPRPTWTPSLLLGDNLLLRGVDGSRVLRGHQVSYVETNSSYAEDSGRVLRGHGDSYVETNAFYAEAIIEGASYVDSWPPTWRQTPPTRSIYSRTPADERLL